MATDMPKQAEKRQLIGAFLLYNGKSIEPHDLKGLKEFRKDYPQATSILIYRGKEKIIRDEILCIPAEKLFVQLNPLSDSL